MPTSKPPPKDGKRSAKPRRKPTPGTLRLLRTEMVEDGILLVYDHDGYEETWLLEQTSLLEFFALILRGQMRAGQRIIIRGDVSLEPPEAHIKQPMLCFSGHPLQTCVPMTKSDLRSLRSEIDHVLSLRS